MPLLQVEDLSSGYGDLKVITNLSIKVEGGEVVALVGANGAGKSTFLKTLAGLLPVMSGRVFMNGTDVSDMTSRERTLKGMILVPEGRQLFWDMSVLENLEIAAYAAHKGAKLVELLKLAFELFPRLQERKLQLAGTMSGGEQQMLAIARGLMAEPKIILLDEPSAGLAPAIVQLVIERIHEVRRHGTTVLLVEQDVSMALQLCDRAYVLDRGSVIAEGSGAQIMNNPQLISAYLGDA
jgi:branched-chain amino acid transport system ATP-binding protein